MTARVCPVHGEYAADGVCRWCEPALPPPTKPLMYLGMKVVIDPTLRGQEWYLRCDGGITPPPLCICEKCLRGFEAPIPLTSLECPECRTKPRTSAVEKAAREYFATRAGMRPLGSTLRRYSTPEGVASHAAFWESKLAKEHAALRWERVARRWETKHPSKWMKLDSTDMDDFAQRMVDALLRWFYGLEPKP